MVPDAPTVVRWSTDALPPAATDAERVAAWAGIVNDRLTPVEVEHDATTPFWVQATIATLGPLTLLELRGSGHRLSRSESGSTAVPG